MYNFKIPVTYKDIINGVKNAWEKLSADIKKAANVSPSLTEISGDSRLKEEFAAIDEKYADQNAGLGLQKLEYDAPTDAEIEEAAKRGISAKYESQKQDIIDKGLKSGALLESEKEDLKENEEKQSQAVKSYYEERKKEAEKDALKRGLARSSVITEKISGFDSGKINSLLELSKNTQEKLAEIQDKITGLETEKETALKKNENSYAEELSEKIKSLKDERDKKIAEVIKYNNTVKEKEAKYASDSKNTDSDTVSQFKQEEKLAAAKKYFDGLTKQEALRQFLADSSMKTNLGTYYDYMLNYLKNRK